MSFYANLKKWKVSFGGAPVAASAGTFGSLTVTPFTAGSIVYSGAGGTYAQDNANLFWGGRRLGIGTNVPVASDAAAVTLQLGSNYILQNVVGNQTSLANNAHYDGSWKYAVTGYATAVRMQGLDITFHSVPSGAAGASIIPWDTTGIKMIIRGATGNVGIGVNNPSAALHLKAGTAAASNAPLKFISGALNTTPEAGAEEFLTNDRYYTGTDGIRRRYAANSEVIRLKGFTVATLPAGTQGDKAFVTDATTPTWNGALTGGGTVTVPVFYNGTAWVSA